MVSLLDRLAVEVGGELWERLVVEVDRNRDVLLLGGELPPDVLVQRFRESSALACAPYQRSAALEPVTVPPRAFRADLGHDSGKLTAELLDPALSGVELREAVPVERLAALPERDRLLELGLAALQSRDDPLELGRALPRMSAPAGLAPGSQD